MRAKDRAVRAMRVMRATVKRLRIFICYSYIRMRTISRPTEQDEYRRNIKFLQRLHKPSLRAVFESANENKTNGI